LLGFKLFNIEFEILNSNIDFNLFQLIKFEVKY